MGKTYPHQQKVALTKYSFVCILQVETLVLLYAPMAQLDRASDYGSEGCGFKSYWACQECLKKYFRNMLRHSFFLPINNIRGYK